MFFWKWYHVDTLFILSLILAEATFAQFQLKENSSRLAKSSWNSSVNLYLFLSNIRVKNEAKIFCWNWNVFSGSVDEVQASLEFNLLLQLSIRSWKIRLLFFPYVKSSYDWKIHIWRISFRWEIKPYMKLFF